MAGTIAGGRKAAAKNKANNPDFYRIIGTKGGKNGNTGGFAVKIPCHCPTIPGYHYVRQCAGKRGGSISRRGKKVTRIEVEYAG